MESNKYNIQQVDTSTFEHLQVLKTEDSKLIESFSVNSLFNRNEDRVRLQIYSTDKVLLKSEENYKRYTEALGGTSVGKDGASILAVDPVEDAKYFGYETGDVILVYSFFTNPFTNNPGSALLSNFFIEQISPDRTELLALSNKLTVEERVKGINKLNHQLENSADYQEFYITFEDYNQQVALNVASQDYLIGGTLDTELAPVFKLYEPLSQNYSEKSIFQVETKIGDSIAFEITTEVIEEVEGVKPLKGPNFNVDVTKVKPNPTELLSYNDLYNYTITGSNYELRSLISNKSAQVATDYSDFSDFILFSSAEERLRNFKYKLDQIHSYEDSIELLNISSSYTGSGGSNSVTFYNNLIEKQFENFDHYDRYLFFQSGSWAWPKISGSISKPYINQRSTDTTVWFNNIIQSASGYDNTNNNQLLNSIPSFIREDVSNEAYLTFANLIGHHFDNIWLYSKAVSDKYNTDHRLNFGISKDLVRSAVESFGIKLYDSEFSTDNLLNTFVGNALDTGSEMISTINLATSGSTVHNQPIAIADYQKEIYKRIYHNLPYLVKTKGTQRGIRALLNCFGLTEDIVSIKQVGGVFADKGRYLGPNEEVTSSLSRIRIDNTGSLSTGSVLSTYVSITKEDYKYADDSPITSVGFDLSEQTNRVIKANLEADFDIDQYIGDPRDATKGEYGSLKDFWRLLEVSSQ